MATPCAVNRVYNPDKYRETPNKKQVFPVLKNKDNACRVEKQKKCAFLDYQTSFEYGGAYPQSIKRIAEINAVLNPVGDLICRCDDFQSRSDIQPVFIEEQWCNTLRKSSQAKPMNKFLRGTDFASWCSMNNILPRYTRKSHFELYEQQKQECTKREKLNAKAVRDWEKYKLKQLHFSKKKERSKQEHDFVQNMAHLTPSKSEARPLKEFQIEQSRLIAKRTTETETRAKEKQGNTRKKQQSIANMHSFERWCTEKRRKRKEYAEQAFLQNGRWKDFWQYDRFLKWSKKPVVLAYSKPSIK